MRISGLRLNGFKSFVDPTELVVADGLTGVVGPNGCGKSNLLEALRWVMGENRPTAMRGSGMEDVIFDGAATRPARNFAEVALLIDNADRLAPKGFNDSDHVEVVRRITRDAGSAYRVNSKDALAREVQMLFADASTGAHSPALVRQGQIADIVGAKPRNRRRILEEAAGISGLYQRRHEAELKLNGAKGNLQRVDDRIEQLAEHLAQLARQARQASRYREIGEALREAEGLLLYLRWREADEAREAAEAELATRAAGTAEAERGARGAAEAREEVEATLPPLREDEAAAAAALQRLVAERDALSDREARSRTAAGALEARIVQLGQDRTREESLTRDAGEMIRRLAEEEAELAEAGEGHEEALARASDAAREAAQVLQGHEGRLSAATEDTARLAARHQSAQRLLDDSIRTRDRAQAAADEARDAQGAAEAALAEAGDRLAAAGAAQEEARGGAERAEARLAEADAGRADAQAREAEARGERSEAEGEAAAISAEAGALRKLLERDGAGDAEMVDLVRAKPGYEKALGAAMGDDLRASPASGDAPSGWVELPAYADPQALPPGAAALSEHVDVPAVLGRRIAQVGLVEAADGPRLQRELKPGQRLVSAEGDLWRWDGLRAAAEDAPSSLALRLEQANRLERLDGELERARARVGQAARAHEEAKTRLAESTEADRAARDERRAADARATEAGRALSTAEADRDIALARKDSQRLALARLEDEATEARAAAKEAETALAALDDLEAARGETEGVKVAVDAARITMMSRRVAHDELVHAGQARLERLARIKEERETWTQRLGNAEGRVAELAERIAASETELEEAAGEPDRIAAERGKLSGAIEEAEARNRTAADARAKAETALREAAIAERAAERAASDAREARAATEARAEAARAALDAAVEQISAARETSPEGLLDSLDADPAKMPEADGLETRVDRLRRQRDALGAVNLRAEEDSRAVQEEHDNLLREKSDLDDAISRLRKGIGELNSEGRERLLSAFEQVNGNFSLLFRHLFGGGDARLEMVESDDPLEAGLEIMCQPPGKKLATLSLLSGGEQTLTAMALIFAVFLANPAPICVLDEVDAPLDDSNVTRFCDLLDEMTRRTRTRFLVITHHAVTMSRMDRLFGVTMAEQGVSQLVSVDLQVAEKMVA